MRFLSTPSARRATAVLPCGLVLLVISIHALREEGDLVGSYHCEAHDISIHALREEGDRLCVASTLPGKKFLSTPSARRATFFRKVVFSRKNRFLSTPSARRATGVVGESCVGVKFLSTPSARRATWKRGVRSAFKIFLSTPSARRATAVLCRQCNMRINFYPRPPRGGRPRTTSTLLLYVTFLSTPSARRATAPWLMDALKLIISIHALREEGDRLQGKSCWTLRTFLSTPSARRATSTSLMKWSSRCNFYPRPPRGGRRTIPVFSPGV